MFHQLVFILGVAVLVQGGNLRGQATLKPLSSCCKIPELGEEKALTECSNPKAAGPILIGFFQCNDIKCVFEKSNWISNESLNNDAYKNHLRSWASRHQGWGDAVELAIKECVDRDLKGYLDVPCKAYDVFTCTSIAFIRKCPNEAWHC